MGVLVQGRARKISRFVLPVSAGRLMPALLVMRRSSTSRTEMQQEVRGETLGTTAELYWMLGAGECPAAQAARHSDETLSCYRVGKRRAIHNDDASNC
jgi:hypothetical protein